MKKKYFIYWFNFEYWYIQIDFILISILLFYLILIENKNKSLILKKFIKLFFNCSVCMVPMVVEIIMGIDVFPSGYPQKIILLSKGIY